MAPLDHRDMTNGAAGDQKRLKSNDKVVAFFCSESTGHMNPMLALTETMSSEGWDVHFFAPRIVRQRIEAAGGTWRQMDTEETEVLAMAHAAVDRMALGVKKPKEFCVLPFRVVPAAVGFLPYLIASVSALRPQFLVWDACAPWAWILSEFLRIPGASFMSALPMPMSARETSTAEFSEDGKKILDACSQAIKVTYGIEYNYNYSYTNYSPYTIVCTSRAWHRAHEEFSREQFRYWGPMISKRKEEGTGNDIVHRILSNASIGRAGSRPLVFCSLGTVATGGAYAIYGKAVEDYYIKALGAAQKLSNVEFIVAVGRQPPVVEEERDGAKRITSLFGQPVPENVVVARSVDQPAVLKRANLFITHCGQNSSTEAVVAGVPVLVAPFFSDQIDNATRFVELGMGLEASYLKELLPTGNMQWKPDYDRVSPTVLADKISRVIAEPSFAEAAQKFLEKQTEELGTPSENVADLVKAMQEAGRGKTPVYCQ
eukprot:TRINITY_DN8510_c0_g1_i1.p1 TRINITY_DN8510_c0_g1~~TRINITY_DN8510_c0_g1_i1.p1  ORF type:complete len:516 (+),score=82.79 TRINITY_DN8510_c0_g1_i1:91-1548(+)